MHAAEHDEFGIGPGRGLSGELEGIAGDIGELDDLVALIVMSEDEEAIAQGGLSPPRSLHKGRVGGRRQIAGTLHAPLGSRVGLPPENEERQRCSGPECDVGVVVTAQITNVLQRVSRADADASLYDGTRTPTRRRQARCGCWSQPIPSARCLRVRQVSSSLPDGDRAAEVSVLPIGEAGGGFVAAYADLAGVTTSTEVVNGLIVTTGRGVRHRRWFRSSAPIEARESRMGSRPDRSARPSPRLVRTEAPPRTRRRSGRPVGP